MKELLMTWQVVDAFTDQVCGTYTSLKGAHRAADAKDLEYGAVRYLIRRMPARPAQMPVPRQGL